MKSVGPKSGRGCLTRGGRQRELQSYFRALTGTILDVVVGCFVGWVAVADLGEPPPFFLDQTQGLDKALGSRLWEVSMEI